MDMERMTAFFAPNPMKTALTICPFSYIINIDIGKKKSPKNVTS